MKLTRAILACLLVFTFVGCASKGLVPLREHLKRHGIAVPYTINSIKVLMTIRYDEDGFERIVAGQGTVVAFQDVEVIDNLVYIPDYEGSMELDVGAAVTFISDPVKLRGRYTRTKSIRISFGKLSSKAIGELSLIEWLEKNPAQYNRLRSYYFVTEHVLAEKLEYQFLDDSGSEIEVGIDKLKDIIGDASAHFKYKTKDKYTLVADEPVVIGYRVVKIEKLKIPETGKESFELREVNPETIYLFTAPGL